MAEALRCAFCRDQLSRRDQALGCASAGCGALYHRACWVECRTDFGACAVLGCGSAAARELSAAGWVWRVLRLLVGALLFPPRLVRAVREQQGERLRSTWVRAWRLAIHMLPRGGQQAGDYLRMLVFLVLTPAVSVGVTLTAQRLHLMSSTAGGWVVLILLLASVLLAPCLLTLIAALAFFGLRGLGRLLAGELAALDRAGQAGSYLARQARGDAKKPA